MGFNSTRLRYKNPAGLKRSDTNALFRGFQPLAQVLDVIQLPRSPTFIVLRGFADFEHEGTSDVSQPAQQHITLFGSQLDLKQSVHHPQSPRANLALSPQTSCAQTEKCLDAVKQNRQRNHGFPSMTKCTPQIGGAQAVNSKVESNAVSAVPDETFSESAKNNAVKPAFSRGGGKATKKPEFQPRLFK